MPTKEELVEMVLRRRAEGIRSMTKEKMVEIIMQEGLDKYVDFEFNSDYGVPGSVRLNRREDGSFELYTIGDRGIEERQVFQNEQEAYYFTVMLLRQKKDIAIKFDDPTIRKGMN